MNLYAHQINVHAKAAGLRPELVTAVVEQESSTNRWAWRPEPAYRYLWNVKTKAPFRTLSNWEQATEIAPPDFPYLGASRNQEWWGQQASWGLMQVMGAVARERGWTGHYFPELCDPDVGLIVGCRHLSALLAWAKGDERLALRAYNAGFAPSAQGDAYAAEVLARIPAPMA